MKLFVYDFLSGSYTYRILHLCEIEYKKRNNILLRIIIEHNSKVKFPKIVIEYVPK